jgi:hypothetical protein
MSRSERAFVLREAKRRVVPGGCVVAADEVRSSSRLGGLAQRIWRVPQAGLGWLLVGSVSSPIADLAGELSAAGLSIRDERRWLFGTLALVVGECAA